MEDGRWKMEDGRWKMEDGRWKMEDGRWKMEDGRWKMEDGRWKMEWRENANRLHTFIKDVSPTPPGISFARPARVRLNRLHTGVGLFRSETN